MCSNEPCASLSDVQTVLDAGQLGTWCYRPRSGELHWDRRCRDLFGVLPEERVDYDAFRAAIHPDDRAWVEALVDRALDPASGGEYSTEYRIIDRRRVERWIEARGRAVFDAAGQPVRFAGIAADISRRKQRELDLEERARLSERCMGILGHDLRNPLSTITCAAALLLQRDELTDAAQVSARRIAASADRMSRMVRDLLDLARCRLQGGLPIEPRPMDLVDICRRIIEELEVAHPAREIRLVAPRRALGTWDPDRLGEVVSNLLGNALAHGADGTPVRVRVRVRRGTAHLAIHNEGPPIPPEVRSTLFEPYQPPNRAAPSGRGSSGLKLGLFISREIVRSHGGAIGITSELDHGTTVRVSLPMTRR